MDVTRNGIARRRYLRLFGALCLVALSACTTAPPITRRPPNALDKYLTAAEQGDAEAQFNLAVCFAKGDGMPQDAVEAVKWFRRAAEQGDANAQLILGVCFFMGTGVKQNKAEAVKWYRRAATQGHAEAQCALGFSFEKGEGRQVVPQGR